jgi:hypothetical protein
VLRLVDLGMSNAEIAALQRHRRHRQDARGPAAGQATACRSRPYVPSTEYLSPS